MGALVHDAKSVAIASIHAMVEGTPEHFAEMYTPDAFTRERMAAPPEAYDPTVPDPHGLINQGQGNATARAIQFYEHDHVNRAALIDLIRSIAARNKAGGWRRLAKQD